MIDRAYDPLSKEDALSQVTFVHDYVQFVFGPHTLSLYAPLLVRAGGRSLARNDVSFCDSICSLIGQKLAAITRHEHEQLEFVFSNGTVVAVSLRSEEAVGPEVAQLSTHGCQIMVEGYDR